MKVAEVVAKDPNRLYKCDACKDIFPIRDLKFEDPDDGITLVALNASFVFVNKDGEVVVSKSQPKSSDGDKVMICPRCDYPHPFGFVCAPDPRVIREVGHA